MNCDGIRYSNSETDLDFDSPSSFKFGQKIKITFKFEFKKVKIVLCLVVGLNHQWWRCVSWVCPYELNSWWVHASLSMQHISYVPLFSDTILVHLPCIFSIRVPTCLPRTRLLYFSINQIIVIYLNKIKRRNTRRFAKDTKVHNGWERVKLEWLTRLNLPWLLY